MANAAAAPATQPLADAPAPAEEGKAPPTIDSHGGKLTPLTSSYLDPSSTVLVLLAILSVLVPRRVRGVSMDWLRLVPGLFLSAVAATGLLPGQWLYSGGFSDHFLLAERWVNGALLAYAFLNLLADALTPLDGREPRRTLWAMAASASGLLILLGLLSVSWYDQNGIPEVSFEPEAALVSLVGAAIGLGLALLWRRLNGWVFELAAAIGILVALILASELLPFGNGITGLSSTLVCLTVATMVGFGMRGMGQAGWTALSGRVIWAWAWVLRAFLIAIGMAISSF